MKNDTVLDRQETAGDTDAMRKIMKSGCLESRVWWFWEFLAWAFGYVRPDIEIEDLVTAEEYERLVKAFKEIT